MIKNVLRDIPVDKMHYLDDLFCDMYYEVEHCNPNLHHCVKMKVYELAYDGVLTEDLAEHLVAGLEKTSQKWEKQTTTQVGKQSGITFSDYTECTFYYMMNRMWNDYSHILGADANIYVKMVKSFLECDNPNHKAFKYAIL